MKKSLIGILIVVFVLSLTFVSVGCKGEVIIPAEEVVEEEVAEEEVAAEEVEEELEIKDKYLIGYSQWIATHPHPASQAEGAKEKAEELSEEYGISIEVITTDAGVGDPQIQVGDLEDLFAQNVDGLLLFGINTEVTVEPLKNLYNANNIPIVITDVGIPPGVEIVSFVNTENYLGGELAGKEMVANIPEGSKVIAFNSAPGNEAVATRIQGFYDVCEEAGMVILPEKVHHVSVEEGKTLMEDTLAAEPDIKGIFANNDVPMVGAASALADAGRTDIRLICFDLTKLAYEMVDNGELLAIVGQDPHLMGSKGMEQLWHALTGQTDKIEETILIDPFMITKENLEEYKDDPLAQK